MLKFYWTLTICLGILITLSGCLEPQYRHGHSVGGRCRLCNLPCGRDGYLPDYNDCPICLCRRLYKSSRCKPMGRFCLPKCQKYINQCPHCVC
ncbi:unnamed protein product [Gordionus sp. m RMFG-2023]